MNILVIGNGVAGMTFAKKMRMLDADADITVLTQEAQPFYIRWQLNEYIAGAKSADALTLYKEEWYEKNRIKVIYNESVTALDAKKKVVFTEKSDYKYDKLVIASGAHSWAPPITGSEKEGVFTLRSLADANRMLNYIDKYNVNKVAHIGGGILGLELGNALKERGISDVTIIEFAPYLLPRQLDEEGAGYLQKRLETKGLSFITGAKTQEIAGGAGDFSVKIEGLEPVPAQMVVISAGVRPNMDFAQKNGVDCGRGIKVNNRLETNLKDIYAAGDCAEYNGMVYGIVPPAQEQADILAKVIAGQDAEYKGSIMQNSLKVVGIDLTSAGIIAPKEDGYEEVVYKDENVYQKAVFKDNRLAGLILFGDNSRAVKLLKLLKAGEAISSPTAIFD